MKKSIPRLRTISRSRPSSSNQPRKKATSKPAAIVPSVLYLTNRLELDLVKLAMHLATIAWFAATPLWMGRKKPPAEQAVIP